jgi:integrase
MATPWKHPKTGIYYLYRQIPDRLRPEMGRRFHKESLGTRDPAEAARLFPAANARLQAQMDEATARVAAQAVADEISIERATAIVTRFLATWKADNVFYPYQALELTWWVEEACVRLHGFVQERYVPSLKSDPPDRKARVRGKLLAGDQWLDFVREKPRSVWIKVCGEILDPLFRFANPPIKRIPANEFTLMEAWNTRVLEDNRRFHDEVDNPAHAPSRSRLRPDMRFGELLTLWAAKRSPRPQSVHEAKNAVDDLIAFFGDVAVMAFTKDMLLDYRDAAENLPVGMPAADRALPFPERVAKHAGSAAKRVGPTTVKKRIGAIQALLGFASQENWIGANVCVGVAVEGAGRAKTPRRSLADDEVGQLFASDLFLRPERLLDRRTKVSDLTLYWIFLLGLTSGARIEEIGQAHRRDVMRRDGVLYIDITDYVSADVGEADLHEKSLKNEGSRRVIPIHDRVLELGFERYVDALEKAGQELLFIDLDPNMFGKVTQEASRRANRHIDAVVSDDPRIAFHSLRHRFKDLGREAEIQERILDQLCGHAPTSVGGRYGSGVGLASLKRNLAKIAFDAVGWDPIVAAARQADWEKLVARLAARVAGRAET